MIKKITLIIELLFKILLCMNNAQEECKKVYVHTFPSSSRHTKEELLDQIISIATCLQRSEIREHRASSRLPSEIHFETIDLKNYDTKKITIQITKASQKTK